MVYSLPQSDSFSSSFSVIFEDKRFFKITNFSFDKKGEAETAFKNSSKEKFSPSKISTPELGKFFLMNFSLIC